MASLSAFSFVPEWPIIIQFFIATAILALTPGPDMTLFVSRSISQGKMAGLACMAGASTGIAIHATMAAVGLSALILASPAAFAGVKIIGAAYLVWIAIQAIRKGSSLTLPNINNKKVSLAQNWATGLAINLLNPKIILFNMTFLPQFVSASDPHASGKLLFLGLIFIPFALPFTIPMIFAADKFSGALKNNPKITRVMDWLLAGLFSAFAVRLLMAQAR